MKRGAVLMLQGTASSVGKSLLTAGLCRVLRQDGLRVAPFKAQNMSNNSFVTADGRELGRAQAVQAESAGIEPIAEMNPILLKPEADHRSQVVVLGRPEGVLRGAEFLTGKRDFWPVVTASLDRLRSEFDVVVIEGAGSPAEINLRAGDIVNMRVALHAAAPVLLVGDIDRGGVFAHVIGTLQLLEPAERQCVRGIIINKFRGTPSLLEPGLVWLTKYTGIPVVGVVPWLDDVGVADEDAVVLEERQPPGRGALDVAVMQFPRIANFDDMDPLAAEPRVALRYVQTPTRFGTPDLVILPGTKATLADLAWLRNQGLADCILEHARKGGVVIGICGGLQMLGGRILDPERVESDADTAMGLGLLPVETTFAPQKATHRVKAWVVADAGILAGCKGLAVSGYEIHMGRTVTKRPALRLSSRSGLSCNGEDGAINDGGTVLGTYLHGIFDNDDLRHAIIVNLAASRTSAGDNIRAAASQTAWSREAAYDRLAAQLRETLDMDFVHQLLRTQ